MEVPIVTIRYLALLALLHSATAITVVILRFRLRVAFGDGGHEILRRAIRAHGNLSEYLPLAILAVGSLEVMDVNTTLIHAALAFLIAARLSHVAAMFTLNLKSRQYLPLRVFGAGGTGLVITASALGLLVVAF